MRLVRSHNYSTNRSAQALSRGRTGLIGLTMPFVHADYLTQIMGGVADALYEQDMRAVISPTAHEHDREVTLLDRLLHGATDGAIILLPAETSAELRALNAHGYPFVVVDPRETLDDGIAVVAASHGSGAKAAVDHLVALGHERIAALTGPRGWAASEERLEGYHASLGRAAIRPRPAYVVEGDFEIGGGEEAAHRLLDLAEPPTAIFAFNDNMAVGVVRAARARGIRLPEQLSVVGFDDSERASIVTPALTSVRQPLQEMGRMAVTLLARLLEGQRVDALRIELATRLVVRESTAPPPE